LTTKKLGALIGFIFATGNLFGFKILLTCLAQLKYEANKIDDNIVVMLQ